MTRSDCQRYGVIIALALLPLIVLGQTNSAGNNSPIAVSPQNSPEKRFALSLIAAKTAEERAALLKARADLVTVRLTQAFFDEESRLSEQSPRAEVERICRIGLEIAETVGNKHEIAKAVLNLGNALDGNEKLAAYQRGLDLSEAADDQQMIAKFLISVGSLEQNRDKQLDFYKRGIIAAEKIGDQKTIAGALGRIGNIYTQNGDYITARDYHMKSLTTKEQLGDLQGISISHSNIGLIDQMQGDLDAAGRHFQKSIEISESITDKEGVAIDSYNLGNVYFVKGDYSDAMTLYLKSLRLSEELGSGGGIEGASTNIANLFNALGNYEQARYYLDRAARIADKTGSTIPQYALSGYAESYKSEGQFEKAIEYYQRLLALKEKSESKDRLAETLVDIGNCYLLIPDPSRAEEYFRRALDLSESTRSNEGIFKALHGVAKAQLARKDFGASLDNANRAQTYFGKLNGTSDDWDLYTTLGRAYMGLRQTQLASLNFEKAIAAVEDRRNQIASGLTEGQGFFQSKVAPYHLMVELSISDDSSAKALEYVERAKARTLLDVLQTGKINFNKVMTADERQREQLLRNELSSLNAQIAKVGDNANSPDPRGTEMEKQLQQKRLEFEDFQVRLYSSHPELRTERGEMKPVALEDAAGLLPDSTSALVEYAVADDKAFLFVITRDAKASEASLRVYPIDVKKKDLATRTETFRSKLADGDLDFAKQAQELYALLLKPAARQLSGKTNLIIVPDDCLWDLPFQALQTGAEKYLVETAAVSYAPSLTALREMKKKSGARKTESEMLAFGNPTVGNATAESVKRVFMGEKLEPLPDAERLVNSLMQMYGAKRAKVFTGADASEETAKAEAPKYRIVQFATHGILNDASPMYSHIVLSRKDGDPNEDGLLEAWEMKDLDLNADLVILSACDTARGKVSSGEGMIGMTWAMFIAGAPASVASQWKVELSSTTELMLEFHRQLLSGKVSKAEALRRAQLKLMRNPKYKHPSYWAAWVIVGDAS